MKRGTPGARPLIDLPSRYVDLGYGVLDTRAGLAWQEQMDDGTFLDRDNTYTWSYDSPFEDPAGMAFTDFLPQVNGTLCASGRP